MQCMNTVMTWPTVSTSSDDTERLGLLLGRQLKPPITVELVSDLGGGKTTFVRGLARGLGSKDFVTSPSFTLNNVYKGRGGLKIHHFDFYRLAEANIMSAQLVESLKERQVITVVEWGGIVLDVLPAKRLTVEFKPVAASENERQIVFRYPDTKTKIKLFKKLEAEWTASRS